MSTAGRVYEAGVIRKTRPMAYPLSPVTIAGGTPSPQRNFRPGIRPSRLARKAISGTASPCMPVNFRIGNTIANVTSFKARGLRVSLA